MGPKTLAVQLKDEIAQFCKKSLKLELNMEKTKITDVKKDMAHYLGFDISRNIRKERKLSKITSSEKRSFKMRTGNTKLKFYLPFKTLLGQLSEKGFMKPFETGSGKIIPTAKTNFIFLDHATIIQRYNSIIRGLNNYYKGANNVNKLHHINFVLKHSCAKTLARKFRLRSRHKTFRKFGPNLTYNDQRSGKSISLQIPRSQNFQGITKRSLENKKDFFMPANWSLRTQSNLFKSCAIYGTNEKYRNAPRKKN